MKLNLDNLKEIISPNLFLDRAFLKPDPDGILSETIFGPIANYRCTCGNLNSKALHAGQVCPKCNVLCTANDLRYKTFAKIELLFPILKKQKQELFIKIIKKQYKKLIDPIQADLNTSVLVFMNYDNSDDTIKLVNDFNINCIPLAITGLYSLYICFYVCAEYYGSTLANIIIKEYFTTTFLVTPPDTRASLVADNNGSIVLYKSEVDDLYISLLSMQKYNREHYIDIINIKTYYEMVRINIESGLNIPIVDDQIKMLDGIVSYFQYFTNRIYDSINALLSGKDGLIRRNLLGKSIDFSSRAVVTCSPELLAYQVRIPKISFIRLFFLEYNYYLKKEKGFIVDKLRILVKKSEATGEESLEFLDEFIDWFFKNAELKQRLLILNRVPSLLIRAV